MTIQRDLTILSQPPIYILLELHIILISLIIYKPSTLIIFPWTFSIQLGAGTSLFYLSQCAIPFCTLSTLEINHLLHVFGIGFQLYGQLKSLHDGMGVLGSTVVLIASQTTRLGKGSSFTVQDKCMPQRSNYGEINLKQIY